MNKKYGITIYVVLIFIVGIFAVISVPYAFSRGGFAYLLPVALSGFMFVIGKILKEYEELVEFFNISYYVADEREEFARIIHDDFIQDIYGAINYLNLENPDVEGSKNLLEELETKARTVMGFYRNNLIEDMTLEENFDTILYNLRKLYPDNDIRFTFEISENSYNYLAETEELRVVLLITKELLNNICKHSRGTYGNYKLDVKNDDIIIEVESDGTTIEQFNKIKDSKKGVVFIKALVRSDGGDIKYSLDGDILKTKVIIRGNR